MIPLVYEIGQYLTIPLGATATKLIAQMSPEEIFRIYVRQIGIGGIAMAGIIGIIRSSKIIAGAFSLAYKEIAHHNSGDEGNTVRTQSDIRMLWVVVLILLTTIALFAFFVLGVVPTIGQAIVALLVVTIISFLFTTVAANATAIVGTNPVSGMTSDDIDSLFSRIDANRIKRHIRHGERTYYWRCRMHSACRSQVDLLPT